MKRWLIGTIWRDGENSWSPGVSVSTAPEALTAQQVMTDFMLHQRALHPERSFSDRVYIVGLDEHLASMDQAGGT